MSLAFTTDRDRRALRSVAAQFFANGMVYATFIPRLPEIRDRVGISVGTLGVVLMFGSMAGLVGSLFTGRVIARLGTKRVMVWGALLSVGSLPVVGFATSPWMLVVGLAGVLFFDVFIDVAMNVQGSALSARRHTPVMNRLHGLWSLGTVTAGSATVVLVRAGVDAPAQLAATALVLVAVLLFIAPGLLPTDEPHAVAAPDPESLPAEPRGPHGAEPRVGETASRAAPTDGGDGRASSRQSARRLTAAALGIGGAAAMTMEVSIGDWATFRLVDDLGTGLGVGGLAFLGFTAGMTAGRLGGDWVQVRLGAGRLLRVATIVAGAGSAAATLVPNAAVAVLGFLVAGLGVATMFPQLYDRAAKADGPPGSGFSAMLVGQRSAAIVSPLVVGALADTAALGVGDAVAVVVLPAAALMFVTTLPSVGATRGTERRASGTTSAPPDA